MTVAGLMGSHVYAGRPFILSGRMTGLGIDSNPTLLQVYLFATVLISASLAMRVEPGLWWEGLDTRGSVSGIKGQCGEGFT